MTPGFFRLLSDPSVRTVLLCGCGGGFDFVHGLSLYPDLVRLGKRVIIGIYSFGDPGKIGGEAPVVFQEGKAVARLVTARDGFLGVSALERGSPALGMYAALPDHVYDRQTFRSVVGGAIVSASQGWYGSRHVPGILESRIRPGQAYGWPLMAMVWGFDVGVVAERSHFPGWIRHCESVAACYDAVDRGRQAVSLRGIENLPRHEDMRNPSGRFM